MNLKELHKLYMTEHPSNPVSFSKFCILRPRECVLANAKGVHNVCVCTFHGNIKLMLEAIGQGTEFRTELINVLVCQNKDDSTVRRDQTCMLGTCKDCARPNQNKRTIFERMVMDKLDLKKIEDTITYSQWKQSEGRTKLQCYISNRDEFIENLYENFCTLLPHHFVSSTQAEFFKRCRDPDFLAPNTAVVQLDFAENYSFVVQDEAQGFHWETLQATIHPFGVWLKIDGVVKFISLAIISDERRHDTETVFAFQKVFVNWLLSKFPFITHIQWWSDGCGGQYKNFKNFGNLFYFLDDFGITSEWHFFATSHGKGAADGISARIKDSARRHSLRSVNSGHILNPKALFDYCESSLPNINFAWVSSEDVSETSDKFKVLSRFQEFKTFPQTRMCHKLKVINKEVAMFRVSCDETPYYISSQAHSSLTSLDAEPIIAVDDWVAVRYSATWYLAQILEVYDETGTFLVHYVDKPGSAPSYKFSGRVQHNNEMIEYQDVISKVNPTTGKTGRTSSHFYLTESEKSIIEDRL